MCRVLFALVLTFLIGITASEADHEGAPTWRPVVLMHGLLATAEAMSHAQGWIQQDFPGIYVHNVEIGTKEDSLFVPINTQVEQFAKAVQSDPKLKNGFNLIGHSQGGLITRAYIERYNNPPVYNYISWAGPNAGVYGTPAFNQLCPDQDCPWLNDLMDIIEEGRWTEEWVQNLLTFATYWKDPMNYNDYLKYSTFLADINNERDQKNSTYRNNILSLNSVLLVYSLIDEIVIPISSPWFQFYKLGQDVTVVPFRQTDQYVQDWLGLQTLDKNGKLFTGSVPCTHHDIPREPCKPYYIQYVQKLLNNTLN